MLSSAGNVLSKVATHVAGGDVPSEGDPLARLRGQVQELERQLAEAGQENDVLNAQVRPCSRVAGWGAGRVGAGRVGGKAGGGQGG